MGGLILSVNTLYRFFCFLKLFIIGCKGLKDVISPIGPFSHASSHIYIARQGHMTLHNHIAVVHVMHS